MGDFTPIIVAVVTTLGTIVAAAFATGQIGKRRGGGSPATATRWREQAELEKARADLATEQRDAARSALEGERSAHATAIAGEQAARAATEARLADAQHNLDDCVRQRDDAFSDLRAQRRGATT